MRYFLYAISGALLISGCGTTSRRPDVIEVLHTQPIVEEYVVKQGDTVSKIASTYNMDPEQLVAINNLLPPYRIFVGQKLRVNNDDTDMVVVKQIFYN
jgi:lipoprotein NlpD